MGLITALLVCVLLAFAADARFLRLRGGGQSSPPPPGSTVLIDTAGNILIDPSGIYLLVSP
jgi:hypothetical protein